MRVLLDTSYLRFDELLLVQAQEEGLKLATLDRLLVAHPLTVTPL